MQALSEKSKKLILKYEGLNQPSDWPGGSSGITIGIGYDLGYCVADQFESDWGPYLSLQAINLLRTAIGLTGIKARNRAPRFKGIKIRRKDAEEVFINRMIPLYQLRTQQAFPQIDRLPLDAQGALVSLVFNRGASMIDKPNEDRRKEMRAIRDALANEQLKEKELLEEIASQIRSMKRLWIGKGLNGLLNRREEEAKLVESCIKLSHPIP